MNVSNQLSNLSTLNFDNIFFSQPKQSNKFNFKRVYINVRNDDDTTGNLIIRLENDLFSNGIRENRDRDGKINDYSFAIQLCDNTSTKTQKEWVSKFEELLVYLKKRVFEIRESIGKHDMKEDDLSHFTKFICKYEFPCIFPKISVRNNHESRFYSSETGCLIDFNTIIRKKMCVKQSAIIIESLYINQKGVYLQIKLYEADVSNIKQQQHQRKRLFKSIKDDIKDDDIKNDDIKNDDNGIEDNGIEDNGKDNIKSDDRPKRLFKPKNQ